MKKKQPPKIVNTPEEVKALQVSFEQELKTNPDYSLEVDPTNKYDFPKLTKDFIKYYIDFRNVNTVAELLGIEQSQANRMFVNYDIQSEIRRINRALYQHRFATKLISLDQIGGFLSSMLLDEYIPLVERLSPMEKLRVVDMILKVNDMKANAMNNPTTLMTKDINTQLKDLSVSTIEKLINSIGTQTTDDKGEIIDVITEQQPLSSEERTYLESLPTEDLLKFIEDTNTHKGGKKE